MKNRTASPTLPRLIIWIALLSAILLFAACVAPAAEVVDEADMSAEEAAALAEGESDAEDAAEEGAMAADDAADEVEKAADDAVDEAEKAVDDAADALESSLRGFEELDADASEAEVDQAFAEFEAASEELVAVAAAEGADVTVIEQALDELEQQLRSSMEGGEPLQAQQEILQAQKDIVQEQLDFLSD